MRFLSRPLGTPELPGGAAFAYGVTVGHTSSMGHPQALQPTSSMDPGRLGGWYLDFWRRRRGRFLVADHSMDVSSRHTAGVTQEVMCESSGTAVTGGIVDCSEQLWPVLHLPNKHELLA